MMPGHKVIRFRAGQASKAQSVEANGMLAGDSIMANSIDSSVQDGLVYQHPNYPKRQANNSELQSILDQRRDLNHKMNKVVN